MLYKERLHFKQYIPSKRSRFEIKTFLAVDETTEFILNAILYTGSGHTLKFDKSQFGYGGAIALELLEPYLHANRTVYMDNYFNSPVLAKTLLDYSTYCCGTLRKNRKFVP